jgi:hypothetical protein
VVCRSEFESLKHAEEARRYLKDLTQAEGVLPVLQEGISSLAGLKKILYRPLWIAGIVLAAAAVSYYFVTPRKLELELENIARTAPSGTASTSNSLSASAVSALSATAPAVNAPSTAPLSGGEPDRIAERLVITITVPLEQEQEAIQRINEVMREHGQFRKETFSSEVREISGSLTAGELSIFFSRIGDSGRASYSRKRLDSVPGTQAVPFVMKLKSAPRAASKSSQTLPPAQKPQIEPAASAPSAPAATPTFGR